MAQAPAPAPTPAVNAPPVNAPPVNAAPAPDIPYGAYQRGLYVTALREATKRLERDPNDTPAMTLLGELFNLGLGVRQDLLGEEGTDQVGELVVLGLAPRGGARRRHTPTMVR